MKKLFITAFLMLSICAFAQNDWEKPQAKPIQQEPQKEKKLSEKKKDKVDEVDVKYLEGAVPVVDGKVVFTLDLDVPGKDAQQIYDITYQVLEDLTKDTNQFPESCIALVNKKEHVIAAKYKEWLVFQNSFLSLDRTIFNYTIIANCSDNHATITLSRISYSYEMNRGTNQGLEETAENWIVDKYALNKSKTKLNKMSGKFRRKTIDRKDYIFKTLTDKLLN